MGAMSTIIAFFDMDYTVLDASSGLEYVKHLREQKRIGARLMLHIVWWSILYKVAAVDMNRAVPKLLSYVGEVSAARLMDDSYAWVDQKLKTHITPRAVELIQIHRQQGHRVALISASTQFAVQPVAEQLGIDFICSQLVIVDDRMTGDVVDPPCYSEGKITWAQRYADEHHAALSDAYFYTDSYSDQPLLDLVGHPIAVNPDTRLKKLAQKRGWPIEKFY
jgi:HAD superfamily hydrolase (TIGR01490 family)